MHIAQSTQANDEPNLPAPDVWRHANDLAAAHATRAPFPGLIPAADILDHALPDLIDRAAHRWPDRPAIIDRGASVTFRRLRGWADRTGRVLAARPSSRRPVALMLPDDATPIAAILGCLAAGRPVLALDRNGPVDRHRAILRESGAEYLLIGEDEHLGAAESLGLPVIAIGGPVVADADEPYGPRAALGLDDPAFILPTSGSTGRPKLIVHSQRSMSERGATIASFNGIRETDVMFPGVALPGSYPFLSNLYAILPRGAALLLTDIQREGIRGLFQRLARDRVTVMRLAPSLWRLIAGMADARTALSTLRIARFAGEPSMRSDVALLRPILPDGCAIMNQYGSTESPLLAWRTGPADDAIDPIRVPAGYPFRQTTTAVILDDDLRPCPPGRVGQLVMRSRYHAIGELRDGHLTDGRMSPDGSAPGSRVYFTGDLARMDENGVYVVLGRSDRQLKRNGLRVEPLEIEDAIRRLPNIRDAFVTVAEDEPLAPLVAYVTADPDVPAMDPADMRQRLRSLLPPTCCLLG